jgi:hypothetical protein
MTSMDAGYPPEAPHPHSVSAHGLSYAADPEPAYQQHAPPAHAPMHADPRPEQYSEPPADLDGSLEQPAYPDDRDERPLQPLTRAAPADERPLHGSTVGQYNLQLQAAAQETPREDAAAEEGELEQLGAAAAKDAEPLMDVLSERVVRCVYSKQWSFRQQACRDLAAAMQGAAPEAILDSSNAPAVFAAVTRVARRALDDSAVVALAALDMLVSALAALSAGVNLAAYSPAAAWSPAVLAASPATPAQVAGCMEPVFPLMLSLLGAANARLRSVATEAILAIAGGAGVPKAAVAHAISRPLGKRDANKPLVLRSRALLLASAAPLLGDALSLSLCTFLTPALTHRDGTVREAAAHMFAVMAGAGGLRALKTVTKDLPAAATDLITKEIAKLKDSGDGDASAAPAPRQPVPEPAQVRSPPPAQKPKSRAAAAPAAPVAVYGNIDIALDDPHSCQFCGVRDPALETEAGQDMHFWQACPMLCQCLLCQQIIEVATLGAHLQGECDADFSTQQAQAYRDNLVKGVSTTVRLVRSAAQEGPSSAAFKQLRAQQHVVRPDIDDSGVCPMCFKAVGPTERDWRVHLLAGPCANNPRTAHLGKDINNN